MVSTGASKSLSVGSNPTTPAGHLGVTRQIASTTSVCGMLDPLNVVDSYSLRGIL